MATYLPSWFTSNNWFNIIYYSVGTNVLPGGSGGGGTGNNGQGKHGRGIGLGGSGTGTPTGTGTSCYATILNVSGTSVNALFIMPGTPLGSITRTSMNSSPNNLSPDYFEDAENANLDNVYVIPGSSSNDSLDALP